MLTSGQIRQLAKLIEEQESLLRARMRKAIPRGTGRGATNPEASVEHASDTIRNSATRGDTGVPPGDADQLLALEAARQRLRSDTYGLCAICDGPISFERLLALPAAQRCLSCQEHHELSSREPPRTLH